MSEVNSEIHAAPVVPPGGELWGVYLGDQSGAMYAAPSRSEAERAAAMLSVRFALSEIAFSAIASPWVGGASAHAESLADWPNNWMPDPGPGEKDYGLQPLPPLPQAAFVHEQLGELYDQWQVQAYAAGYAQDCIKPLTPVAPELFRSVVRARTEAEELAACKALAKFLNDDLDRSMGHAPSAGDES